MANDTKKPGESTTDPVAELAKLKKEKAQLAEMLAEANERNAQLSSTKGNKNPVGEHEGNSYQTHGPVRWNGEVLQPEQYIHMPEVMKHLVDKDSSRLSRIS